MDAAELVGEARERERTPMPPRERFVAGTVAVTFAFAAVLVATLVPTNRDFDPLLIAGLVVLVAVARLVRFEVGTSEATIDQLAFIPLLFLAPLPLVPLLTAVAYVIARVPDFTRRRMHPDRWLYCAGDAWHSVPMVIVLATLAPGPVAMEHLGVYALALVAQMVAGFALIAITDTLVHRASFDEILRMVAGPVFQIDALLTPVALMLAAVGTQEPIAVAGVIPLMWLVHLFSAERKERYAAALELNQAYRGTVMVLSDVVEAEDNYTASHCRSVVELAGAVAEEMGLDSRTRQELEIAALLHDVGKIAIPNEILNKPAKLTDEEFDLMKTHTIEGQALLDRVGGRLAKVGKIVRSCHERWDGRGYPDGLIGEQIPVAARIVFCCDAYSAMTTDRPYRSAMSRDDALKELRANSGSQFEPRVVKALEQVVLNELAQPDDERYGDALRAVLAGNHHAALELTA
jgi:putative nucleotidyltransferase with HDIG domain